MFCFALLFHQFWLASLASCRTNFESQYPLVQSLVGAGSKVVRKVCVYWRHLGGESLTLAAKGGNCCVFTECMVILKNQEHVKIHYNEVGIKYRSI